MYKHIIFLDMDGVIADFVKGACDLHDKRFEDVYRREVWGPEAWEIQKLFDMTHSEFYDKMDREFWANLPLTKEGPAIIEQLEDAFGRRNIYILTAPTRNEDCIAGKIEWMRKHIPWYVEHNHTIYTSQKWLLAQGLEDERVLVDDSTDNIDKFSAAGGITIPVPRPWNAWHTDADRTLPFILDYIWEVTG